MKKKVMYGLIGIAALLLILALIIGFVAYSGNRLEYKDYFNANYIEKGNLTKTLKISIPKEKQILLENFETALFRLLGDTQFFYSPQGDWGNPGALLPLDSERLKPNAEEDFRFIQVAKSESGSYFFLTLIRDEKKNINNGAGINDFRIYEIYLGEVEPFDDPKGLLKSLVNPINRIVKGIFPREYRAEFES